LAGLGRGLGHNDHYKTGQIVANAYNLAHLRKAPVEGEPHQAKAIYFYFLPPGTLPTFVVDVTEQFRFARAAGLHEKVPRKRKNHPAPGFPVLLLQLPYLRLRKRAGCARPL
jgi:LmbE family N-acetylglucosaminyl deacetylase